MFRASLVLVPVRRLLAFLSSRQTASRRLGGAAAAALALVILSRLGFSGPEIALAQTGCSDIGVCASGVFCSGFEEGNKAIWNDYDGNPDSTNLLMTDPGPCGRTDNHIMRLRVPPGRGGADLVKLLPGSYDKLYARWYQKWESGYDFAVGNHGGGLHAGDRNLLGRSDARPSGADWFTTWLEPLSLQGPTLDGRARLYSYYRGMSQQCSDPAPGPQPGCWGDSFPTPSQRTTIMPPIFQADRWYCLELMLDGGTPVASQALADGVQTFWVDGVQYGPWTRLWHRTTASLKINILWLSLFQHGTHSVGGVMLDDVVVSTSRIGCHGAPGPPLAPTNVRILRLLSE